MRERDGTPAHLVVVSDPFFLEEDINSVELKGARLSMVINASEFLQSASGLFAFLVNRAA